MSWSFVFEILKLKGFPSKWIEWIKACVGGGGGGGSVLTSMVREAISLALIEGLDRVTPSPLFSLIWLVMP